MIPISILRHATELKAKQQKEKDEYLFHNRVVLLFRGKDNKNVEVLKC
jgi:hypothetical protein